MASTETDPVGGSRARRWTAAALAVVVPALVLRGCVLSTFVIRLHSMEPTLKAGDHLVVLKSGVDPRDLQRWDVALFDDAIDAEVPDDIDAVVKRIVGLPGELVAIRDGDVHVGVSPGELGLARKPDEFVRRLLVPVSRTIGLAAPWTGPTRARTELATGTRLAAPPGEEVLYFALPVLDGMLGEDGEALVADTALEVLVGEGHGVLVLRLREGADSFLVRLAPAARGGAELHHNLGGGRVDAAATWPGLRPGQRVLFWNVDDGVRVFVDEQLLLTYDYAGNTPQTPGTVLNNVPGLGVDGGELELREVTILRDLHYGDQGVHATGPEGSLTPCQVLAAEVFVLGDLSRSSRDSRHFGAIGLSHLLGRPVARYRPWARACWLGREGVGDP